MEIGLPEGSGGSVERDPAVGCCCCCCHRWGKDCRWPVPTAAVEGKTCWSKEAVGRRRWGWLCRPLVGGDEALAGQRLEKERWGESAGYVFGRRRGEESLCAEGAGLFGREWEQPKGRWPEPKWGSVRFVFGKERGSGRLWEMTGGVGEGRKRRAAVAWGVKKMVEPAEKENQKRGGRLLLKKRWV